ncbi:MAG: rhodanese-like domain-containing protein [Terrimicrobiaceae bacterium]|nr:rhodanese-like domain-containing protein [Terrimicrobiaceae bacterium]
MATITPADLQKLLTASPDLPVLDVRTPAEFAEAHVPQARNIPLGELRPDALDQSKNEPVYLLCHSGGRATRAAEQLARAGYAQLLVVEGGTQSWIAAGLPVTRGAVKVISLERQVRIAAGSLVLLGVLLGWLVNPAFFGIAGFVGAGLVVAGITDFCGMGLLLAKLPWNTRKPA